MVRLNEIRTGESVVDIALPTDAAIAFIGRVTPLAPRQPGDDEVGDPDDNSVLPLQHDANGRCKRKVLMKLSARNQFKGKIVDVAKGATTSHCSHRYWRWRHRYVLHYQRDRCRS